MKEQKLPVKYYQLHELLIYFGKGFKSFHTGNVGSVGKRATKLLDVKGGGVKEKFSASAIKTEMCASLKV